jgi:hypothetical protein
MHEPAASIAGIVDLLRAVLHILLHCRHDSIAFVGRQSLVALSLINNYQPTLTSVALVYLYFPMGLEESNLCVSTTTSAG